MELASGKVDFKIIEETSKKTGKPYKCIKLVFGSYELRTPVFINEDQYLLIQSNLQKKAL